MAEYKELPYTKLKRFCNPDQFAFRTTEDLIFNDNIIGQDRAVRAMEFGLRVKSSQYNIFVTGLKGTGKTSYAQRIVSERAKDENVPDDWCYVYNFDNPGVPLALNVPPGMGKILVEDMDILVQDLLTEIPKAFHGEDYEKRKAEIVKKYQDERNQLIEELTEYSKEQGFKIKNTSTGFALAPLINGEVISDGEYSDLDEEQRIEIETKAEDIQDRAVEILRKIKEMERQAKKKIIDLDNTLGLYVVEPLMDELFDKYKEHTKVIEYIKNVQNDVIEQIYDFDLSEEEQDELVVKKAENNFVKKYKVNLFIDNSNTTGAPIVMECNPNYNNLVGRIEYENEQGSLKTDFTMIKPGAIHRANGGYLILQANQVLTNAQSWDLLKRTIETGQISIENLRMQLGIVEVTTLKPEPIPVDIKVILIGNPYLYQLLYNHDEDFEKLFKVKVDFDSVMNTNRENEQKIANFISDYCDRKELKHLDREAVAKVVEYSHKIAGSQKKLSTRFNKIIELLIEADVWADIDKSELVRKEHIDKAYEEKQYRNNRMEEKLDEMYETGKIIIDLKGKKIGRINGLSVIDVGDHSFGKPSVITVTTYAGNRGVVNIEREVKMSGKIHDKGVLILEGYLSEKFGQEYPVTLTAKICFEQSYSGVDGDSASSTELYGLLSSLSDIPLKQHIAVTGSVNQKGEIQPVGGVTEKIEGFFSLCRYFGLTGDQGVIIPHQNVDDLVLKDEIVEAVRDGKFHIYPVAMVEEGIEILTDQSFPKISEAVIEKLYKFTAIVKKDDDSESRKGFRGRTSKGK
ncbi:MAG: family ATPase [Anaerosolibacter sp.]|jgi:lon-related putative ATP-dependent protease|uniref:Lon protease family protein n=1 Tax=Anaerosolibacter sp. TaxID=1872527 RepID=UPI002622CB21|nr:ATP-binding protein [Anaerosolibacter sp.]MDF2546247.1 family ATPase [Anaerosolibacter sp.]